MLRVYTKITEVWKQYTSVLRVYTKITKAWKQYTSVLREITDLSENKQGCSKSTRSLSQSRPVNIYEA